MRCIIELSATLKRKGIVYPAGCQFTVAELVEERITTVAIDPWGNTVRLPTRLVRIVDSHSPPPATPKPARTLAAIIRSGAVTRGIR